MSFVISGCAKTPTIKIVENDFCIYSKPIFIGEEDQISADTARQILYHNELFEEICNKSK